jgi:hypothetical protein
MFSIISLLQQVNFLHLHDVADAKSKGPEFRIVTPACDLLLSAKVIVRNRSPVASAFRGGASGGFEFPEDAAWLAARVPEIAARYRLTPAQVSLLWVKDQIGVTAPIIDPRTPEQFAELRADDALHAAFDRLNPPGMAVSNFHNTSGWMKASVSPDWRVVYPIRKRRSRTASERWVELGVL